MDAKESAKTDNESNDGVLTPVDGATTNCSGNPTTTESQVISSSIPNDSATMAPVETTSTTPPVSNQPKNTSTTHENKVAGKNSAESTGSATKGSKTQNVNASSQTSPKQKEPEVNSGNDRVTVDKLHEPLVPSENSLSTSKKASTKSTSGTSAPTSATDGDKTGNSTQASKSTSAKPDSTKSPSNSAAPKAPPELPAQPDEQTLLEEAIKKERSPLVDKYSPFIIPSDTKLEDARSRLRIAIEQTRQLRAAFTERVYGKYRVCLLPPATTEEILIRILSDPNTEHEKLVEYIKEAKAEKEVEKKEAQKLNAEMVAANTAGNVEGSTTPNPATTMNAENAEQLMYISAGLSAIILPEQDVVKDNIDTSSYPDRAPVNPETGQRVRSISAAAAAAGEVMLDRARKGAAMRAERHRRKQLQLKAGNDGSTEADNNYSRLQLLSNSPAPPPPVPQPKPAPPVAVPQSPAPPPKPAPKASSASTTKALLATKPFKKPSPPKPPTSTIPSPASAKVIRARVQASMSLNMLLSLNPSAEDLDGKPCSATKAMLERGVAPHNANSKTNQQRIRHPFPESLGGRRGAITSGQIKKDSTSQETLLHPSYNSLALPPFPTARERRSYKPVPVLDTATAGSSRAKAAIRCVLGQFKLGTEETQKTEPSARPHKRRITEISFLHGVRSSIENENDQSASYGQNATIRKPDIDPILAFNVLRAVGLIRHSPAGEDGENVVFGKELDSSLFDNAEKGAMSGEDGSTTRRAVSKLRRLHNKFTSSKRSFTDAFAERDELALSAPVLSQGASHQPPAANTTSTESIIPPRNPEEGAVAQGKDPIEAPAAQTPPVVSIRGGGEVRKGSKDGDGKGGPTIEGNPAGSPGERRRDQSTHENMQAQRSNMSMNLPTNHLAQQGAAMRPGMVWEDPSRQSLALMHPRLVEQGYTLAPGGHQNVVGQHANGTSNPRNAQMQGQMQSPEQFHHHSTANALQLAHHLRHATSSMSRLQQHGLHGGGDLAEYIGGLHSQPGAGYDWSTISGASHSQIAALRIHPHRAAMMNFSVQDRTRALIAREQQNAAAAAAAHAAHRQSLSSQQAVNFLGGAANHGYPPAGSPHFPHIAGPAAALLNSSAALMGHHGMPQVSSPAQVQAAARMHTQQDQRIAQQKTEHATKKEAKGSKETKREQVPAAGSEKPKRPDQSKGGEKKASSSSNAGTKRENASSEDKAGKSPPAKKPKVAESVQKSGSTEKETCPPVVAAEISADTNSPPEPAHSIPTEEVAQSEKEAPAAEEESKEAIPNEDTSSPSSATSPVNTKEIPTSTATNAGSVTSDQPSDVPKAMDVEITTDAGAAIDSEATTTNIYDANSKPAPQSNPGGLQFFVPPAPPVLPADAASLVLAARSHEAIELLDNVGATCDAVDLVNYLLAVGSAVPIPKALAAQPLKEKLAAIIIKNNPIGTFPAMSREAIAASVLLWLWRSHEDCFQRAFAKNGRIDVDPGCKWLINAAVDKAVDALAKEIGDSGSRAGVQLTAALQTLRTKGATAHKAPQGVEMERLSLISTKLDLLTISIVCRELMSGIVVDSFTNSLLPHFDDLLSYLDDTRKYVLYSKAQERVFLANLISRKATMSLPFSHAYVSSMVRAGEALGHGELFEVVQNEDVNVSTNIPYDVFTDESGAWEDPCRPAEGYTRGLTGDDLMRRAHARAMIQKSLKKLQDRHNIKGGTSHPGPYIDPPNSSSGAASDSSKSYSGSGTSTTPRGWVKRRSSFSEPPVQAGTGSAAATSWSLYDPRHYSAPLIWKAEDSENSPYGRRNKAKRPRSLSVSQASAKSGGKNARGKASGRSMSVSSMEHAKQEANDDPMRRSTHEIKLSDVANIFQNVKLPGNAAAQKEKEARAALRQKTIFAPFVRKVDVSFDDIDSESDDDEDLSDETVLGRHQFVLDKMKEKLSAVFDARKKSQDRRKSRDKTT